MFTSTYDIAVYHGAENEESLFWGYNWTDDGDFRLIQKRFTCRIYLSYI